MISLLTAVSLTVFAAPAKHERIVSVQIDNLTGLATSIGKLGNLLGNPMLGTMAAGQLGALAAENFAPMSSEPNKTVLLSLYLDSEKPLGSDPVVTAVYPLEGTVKEFLASRSNLKQENGVITVEKGLFAVGSSDGRWLAFASDPAWTKVALKDIPEAMKPTHGDSIRIRLSEKGLAVIADLMRTAQEKLVKMAEGDAALRKQMMVSRQRLEQVVRLVREISAFMLGVKISDQGLDFGYRLAPRVGGELAKVGRQALAPSGLFAGVGSDAVSASAWAKDSGSWCGAREGAEGLKALVALLDLAKADFGLDVRRFLTVEQKGGRSRLALDIPAFVRVLQDLQGNSATHREIERKLADEKFLNAELDKVNAILKGQNHPFVAACPAGEGEFAITGYSAVAPMAQRFAATLPEVSAKPVYQASFFSLYSLFQAVRPTVLGLLSPQDRANLKPVLEILPPEGKDGIAAAAWAEKGELRGVMRVSAGELKRLAQSIATVISCQSIRAMRQGAMPKADASDNDD